MNKKVYFHLEQDDGYPPISIEMLNVSALGGDLYRIENTPFFISNVSYNDVVMAVPNDATEHLEFKAVVEQSDFTALSIILMDSSMDTLLMDLFRGLDCVIEYGEFGVYRVLAVAVPSNVDYESLREELQSFEDRELISYSELAVGP